MANPLTECRSSVIGHSGLSLVDRLFFASCKNKIQVCCYFYAAHLYISIVISIGNTLYFYSPINRSQQSLIYLQNFLLAFKISCFSKLASPSRFLLGLNEILTSWLLWPKKLTVICIKGIVNWGNHWNIFFFWKPELEWYQQEL